DVEAIDIDSLSFDGLGGWDAVTINGGAPVTYPATQHFQTLSIADGGAATVLAGSNSVLVARQLSLAAAAKLDLFDNDLILDYAGASQLPAVQALINAARNGGMWNSSGIASGTAKENAQHNTTLGAMEAADYLALYGQNATFDGEALDA